MRVFLDAGVLFDSMHDGRIRTLLQRIKNAGNEVIVPASVLGEIMLVCISEERMDELLGIGNTCSELETSFAVSSEQFKVCNICLEKFDKRSFNITDKEHLAHVLAYCSFFDDDEDNYFLTTDLYLLDFRLPCSDPERSCGRFGHPNPIKIVDVEEIRSFL
jgi:predicted nucleic acid-binding protein